MKIIHLLIPTTPVSQRSELAFSEYSGTFFAGPCRDVPDTTQDCKICLYFKPFFRLFFFWKSSQNICHFSSKDLEMHFLYDFSSRIFIWLLSHLFVMFLGDKVCALYSSNCLAYRLRTATRAVSSQFIPETSTNMMRTEFYVIYCNRLFSHQLH